MAVSGTPPSKSVTLRPRALFPLIPFGPVRQGSWPTLGRKRPGMPFRRPRETRPRMTSREGRSAVVESACQSSYVRRPRDGRPARDGRDDGLPDGVPQREERVLVVSGRVLDVTSHELMTDYLAAGERGDWDVGDGTRGTSADAQGREVKLPRNSLPLATAGQHDLGSCSPSSARRRDARSLQAFATPHRVR
jgi:hypothetical protein